MINGPDSHAAFYNSLSTVNDANDALVPDVRDKFFAEIAPVLAKYSNDGKAQFGVCLVHRHFELYDGEKMVSQGDITKPERDVECVPYRWTARGEPFEFTLADEKENVTPLDSLLKEFQTIADAYKIQVLGLFRVKEDCSSRGVPTERTDAERRMHILEYDSPTRSLNSVNTDWVVHSATDIRMVTECTCEVPGHDPKTLPKPVNPV